MSVIYEEQGIAADGNVAAKCNYGNLESNGDGSADLYAPCHQLADDWVKRVLGIEITVIATVSGAQGSTGPRPKLTPIWGDAKEEVDAGISRLQAALRETGDDDLEQIAEFGLFGASDGENVALTVALRKADTGAEGGARQSRERGCRLQGLPRWSTDHRPDREQPVRRHGAAA